MGRGRSGHLPSWHKGRLINETFGDFWYGSREGKLSLQEGRLVDRQMRDSLTDKQRQDLIQQLINR